MAAGPHGDAALTEGEAIVAGAVAVTLRGTLLRVFAVAGHWFAEVECWPHGSGAFTAPLRAVRIEETGARVEPPREGPPASHGRI
jgi:hypothetical protein